MHMAFGTKGKDLFLITLTHPVYLVRILYLCTVGPLEGCNLTALDSRLGWNTFLLILNIGTVVFANDPCLALWSVWLQFVYNLLQFV